MMLIEQLIHTHALEIVEAIPASDPAKTRYRQAASKLRLPYWDWAEKTPQGDAHSLPSSIMEDTLPITYPNGTASTIVNPIRRYTFNPLVPQDFEGAGFPYDKWKTTLRWPNDPESPDAQDNVEAVYERFDINLEGRRSSLYKVFKSWQRFNQFSNVGNSPDWTIGDIESVHGGTHVDFLYGHMTFSTVAAFDPVFWLHHANVDRQV
jgi:tyrosinase